MSTHQASPTPKPLVIAGPKVVAPDASPFRHVAREVLPKAAALLLPKQPSGPPPKAAVDAAQEDFLRVAGGDSQPQHINSYIAWVRQ